MPVPNKIDNALAQQMHIAMLNSLPSLAMMMWKSPDAEPGERVLVPYRCTDIYEGKTDWTNLEAACGHILKDLVPIVSGKKVHQATAEKSFTLLLVAILIPTNHYNFVAGSALTPLSPHYNTSDSPFPFPFPFSLTRLK